MQYIHVCMCSVWVQKSTWCQISRLTPLQEVDWLQTCYEVLVPTGYPGFSSAVRARAGLWHKEASREAPGGYDACQFNPQILKDAQQNSEKSPVAWQETRFSRVFSLYLDMSVHGKPLRARHFLLWLSLKVVFLNPDPSLSPFSVCLLPFIRKLFCQSFVLELVVFPVGWVLWACDCWGGLGHNTVAFLRFFLTCFTLGTVLCFCFWEQLGWIV